MPAKNGRRTRSSSSCCCCGIALLLAQGGDLFDDVDPDRAPRDAAPAPDAAGRAELVDPRAELVRQPLPVARAGRRADRAAVDVRVVEGEARVPDALARRLSAGQVARV